MGNSLLLVDNINSYYNTIHALYDISFHVDTGEIVTLIGANGAGKSTTLKTISGLMRSQTGGIVFDGINITKYPAYKIAEIGLAHVPEGRRVFSQLTVLENLEMGAYTQPQNELSDSLEKVYALFPRLKERMKQIAGTLSGGEQQMLAMGRALMSKPKLMMLDEPSMGLSPILVQEVFNIIKDLHNDGTTILLVEQNAQMALSIADRGYVLESGKIVIEDTASKLANNNLVKKAYLGG
ncbi:MAG: ABC transporter ATP-binding protein [Oscillospiraceae bacterium]|nr:ABC transporter ATP-binding protein [Oscillospiraceae bacterium]